MTDTLHFIGERIEHLLAEGLDAFDIQQVLLAELTAEERELLALRGLEHKLNRAATVDRIIADAGGGPLQ